MLPISYSPATVRTVTPVCEACGRIGVAFNMDTPSGLQVVRLALDAANADVLCRLLADYMDAPKVCAAPASQALAATENVAVEVAHA